MRGSWAGAMGHTQWMPEVWLNVGIDYDGDGKVSPFGKPDDALGLTREDIWSIAANITAASIGATRCARPARHREAAAPMRRGSAGVTRADGQPFPQPNCIRADCGCRLRAGRHSCSGRISMR